MVNSPVSPRLRCCSCSFSLSFLCACVDKFDMAPWQLWHQHIWLVSPFTQKRKKLFWILMNELQGLNCQFSKCNEKATPQLYDKSLPLWGIIAILSRNSTLCVLFSWFPYSRPCAIIPCALEHCGKQKMHDSAAWEKADWKRHKSSEVLLFSLTNQVFVLLSSTFYI